MRHWLMTAALLLCSITARAEAIQIDGIWYNLTAETYQAEVTSATDGTKYTGAVDIPASVMYADEEYSVTSIGSKAFYYCYNLTSITIPESVTKIGERAFADCGYLSTLVIPQSVTSIGSHAFYYCNAEKLTVNCNIPSGTSNYEGGFYYGKFVEVIIGDNVSSIGDYAFEDCRDLKSITIPESVTEIKSYAFYNCYSLTSITIPKNVAKIGEGAFVRCSGLTSIVVAEENTKYDSRNNCNAIIVTRTNALITGCNTTTIPEGVTSIGASAFANCRSLTTVVIPNGVTSIGDGAFSDCIFTSMVIPQSVTSIGGGAFRFSKGKLNVNCNIPSVSSETSSAFYNSGISEIVFGDNVTSIGNYAFANCTSLTSVIISESVTSMGKGAFKDCLKLASITIPENSKLTSIGEGAFNDCRELISITIPKGITSIGSETFEYCYNLASITLPDNMTDIGNYAFVDCRSLTSITIPESVASIGTDAFNGCSGLTFINIPKKVTAISHRTFYRCSSLTSINIHEGVTSIGNSSFKDCDNLTTVTLPNTLKQIYPSAFANCAELLDIYCNAESVPNTTADAFNGSYPEYVTLHVPAKAMVSYKATAPWSNFGEIVSLTNELITGITLNQNAVTLVEGEQLQLIATITPDYATDPSVTWSSSDENVAIVDANGIVTAIASGTAIITATANDGSNVSASSEVTVERLTHVSLTVSQYGSGTYSSEYALDFSEVKGLKAYAASAYNSHTGVVTLLRLKTTKPSEGIFVKGEPGTYKIPIIEESADNTLNMLVGTLTETIVNTLSNDGLYTNYKYTIKEGDTEPMFYQFADGSTQDAGRAYLQIPTAWLTSSEAKSISYRFDDGETTDIEDNSNLEIRNSELEFYDLMGRRVENPVKNGIYIVNGEKIVY